MSDTQPYTMTFAGQEYEVFPHKARMVKPDSHGHRPVTVGGYVIGYTAKIDGNYYGYNDDHTFAAITTDKLGKCAELLATRDAAREAYRVASSEGVFGVEAREAEEARMDQVIRNLDETAELVEVDVPALDFNALDTLRSVRAGRGSAWAETRLLYTDTGELIGTLVREPSYDFEVPVWAAHTPAGRRTQGMAYSEAKQVLLDAHRDSQTPVEPEDSYAWSDVCHEPVNNQGGECGAPLAADGTCPGVRGHAAEMHRRDRDRHLDDARRYLLKAIEEHEALRQLAPVLREGRRDYAGEVIENLYDQVRNLSDHLDGLSV